MNAAAATERDHPGAASGRAVLIIACVAQFMVVLDISIVNVALPAMREALGLTTAGQQWIVNAYALVFGGCLLCGGRAADVFGRRRTLIAGLTLFSLASLAGGLAQSGGMLIAARAVQGLGAAILAPATLSLLTTTFVDPRERTRALTAWSMTAASGGACGAALGGVLTDVFGWRSVLFVNVPIGAALVFGAVTRLRPQRQEVHSRSLDLPGAALVTSGLALLVYAIVTTDTHSWGSAHTLGLLAGAALLLGLFVWVEAHVAEPLVPLRIFASRALTGANLIAVGLGGVITALIFFLSLYLQQVNGYSPLQAGIALLAPTAAALLASMTSGRLVGRVGPRALLIAGPLLATLGQLWLSRLHAGESYFPDVFAPAVVTVFGLGSCFVPMTMCATAGVPMRDAGLASGIINSSRQVGGAVLLAALVTIATSHTASVMHTATEAEALVAGYDRAFVIGAVLTLGMAAVAGIVLPRFRPRAATAPQGATPASVHPDA